jgi:hypothetical protein
LKNDKKNGKAYKTIQKQHQKIPTIIERQKIQINLRTELTTMLTGHGKLKAYYYRFKIIEDLTCICGGRKQTAYHLLYDTANFTIKKECN